MWSICKVAQIPLKVCHSSSETSIFEYWYWFPSIKYQFGILKLGQRAISKEWKKHLKFQNTIICNQWVIWLSYIHINTIYRGTSVIRKDLKARIFGFPEKGTLKKMSRRSQKRLIKFFPVRTESLEAPWPHTTISPWWN